MDRQKHKKRENPEENANIISLLFMWWTRTIFCKAFRKKLTFHDIYEPSDGDRSEYLGNRLEKEWNSQLKRYRKLENDLSEKNVDKSAKAHYRDLSLTKALIRTFFWPNAVLAAIIFFDMVLFRILQAIFQSKVIFYFRTDNVEVNQGKYFVCLYASYMILSKIMSSLIFNHYFNFSSRIGMQARVACCSLMYRKILRLNKAVISSVTAGQIINLMSNDVSRFDNFFTFCHFIWIAPLQATIISYLIWKEIGLTVFAGILVLLWLSIPVQVLVTYASKKLRSKIAILTDKRVQLMAEVISGIQTLKMLSWESPFEKMIKEVRSAEMKKIKYSSLVRSIFASSMCYTERISLFVALILYVLSGGKLTADLSFLMATLFNILQLTCSILLPMGMIATGELSVSIKRIQEFLLLEEKNHFQLKMLKDVTEVTDDSLSPYQVILHQVSANWINGTIPPTLEQLSFTVAPGALCGLTGAVGCGKTAVVHLLLQELNLEAGGIIIAKNYNRDVDHEITLKSEFYVDSAELQISFASQEPWLITGTLRDNILFESAYNSSRYNEVVKVCALERDFMQLPLGDLTMVGDNGTSISGGQKARINLARSVYRTSDIYLLDDPLSGVDSKVAREIFQMCIFEYLKGKTRIIVTHQLEILQKCDLVVVLEQGSVKYCGPFETIGDSSAEILKKLSLNDEEGKEKDDIITSNAVEDEISSQLLKDEESYKRISQTSFYSQPLTSNVNMDEFSEMISINCKLLKDYIRSGSSTFFLTFYLTSLFLTQLALSGSDYWLCYWTNIEEVRASNRNSRTIKKSLVPTIQAIYIYSICIICCVIFSILRNVLLTYITLSASKTIHCNMFKNLMQSTMGFFNSNPSGRILNRFSKDIGAIDEIIPRDAIDFIQMISAVIGILVLIVVSNYWTIIPIFIILLLFYLINILYLKTIQSIKTLEGAARSLVFSHVNSTVSGLITIRSCESQVQKKFTETFYQYLDDHSGIWYMSIAAATSIGIFIDGVAIALTATVCFILIFIGNGSVSSGSVGLVLSQSAVLSSMANYGMRLLSELVSQMSSIARVMTYENLPKEFQNGQPVRSENWPNRGTIKFHNISMKYDTSPNLVLKNLSLNVESGWKVGIVGRTGAGKSSIVWALFRLSELAEGHITIDGEDIAKITLKDLRAKISVIPQEPVLFSQSLRRNLDPASEFSDGVLYDALNQVELSGISLDQMVAERGSNFSAGQRQLICLARAIVKDNKILVLDEATAHIDNHTDSIIQNVVRKTFSHCTVLTIAHRLSTVIDNDRVVVIDNGEIVEFGCPHKLLTKNRDGYFSRMIDQAGEDAAAKLREAARRVCLENIRQRSVEISEQSEENTKM